MTPIERAFYGEFVRNAHPFYAAQRQDGRDRGFTMLLALVLGITLGIVGTTLLRQWLTGALSEDHAAVRLSPDRFPHLAPPGRPRHPRLGLYARRAA